MPTEPPLVSVVMPLKTVNPTFLRKSVESILNQSLTDLELIIVMENAEQSVNKSAFDILEEFPNDERLKIVNNKEKGFVGALNCGILASRGEYVARMDGDDISLPNRLEKQVKAAKQFHLDLIGGWAYVIDEYGSTIGKLTPPTDSFNIRRTIMFYNPFIHSAMLFKKSILQDSGLYNKALCGAEDYDLWLRLVSLGYTYANLPDYMILKRETSNSLTRGKQWKTIRTNVVKAKFLGLTKLGYHDPLSVSFCFAGPFSLLIGPKTTWRLELPFGYFKSLK